MNTEWSELNKKVQLQMKNKDTFYLGIETLLTLRNELMKQILDFKNVLSREDFNAIPFMNANG